MRIPGREMMDVLAACVEDGGGVRVESLVGRREDDGLGHATASVRMTLAALLLAACASPVAPPVERTFVGQWTFTTSGVETHICEGGVRFASTGPDTIEGRLGCTGATSRFTGTLSEGRISVALTTGCSAPWVPLPGTLVDGTLELAGRWDIECPSGLFDYGIAFTGVES